MSLIEVISFKLHKLSIKEINLWFVGCVIPRIIFVALSFPVFIYMQKMFTISPWKYLALFDIEHRTPLPYDQYLQAVGIMLPLGIMGLIMGLLKQERKLFLPISWVISVFLLFAVFEKVPIQSPLRFTESSIHIPLGILAAYFFHTLISSTHKWMRSHASVGKRLGGRIIIILLNTIIVGIIIIGISVMLSMFMWLKDQTDAKRTGGWTVPIGAQLAYPLKDFMDGIYYFRDNTKQEKVVLSFITAGNYIPAYAGNYVYLGHANTPDEIRKEGIVKRFFKGEMTVTEAENFLIKERISYIYLGPQEKELGGLQNLDKIYPYISQVYQNGMVKIYEVNKLPGGGR
jgi:hypothetical protein